MRNCFMRTVSVILMASTAILMAGCTGSDKTKPVAPPVTMGVIDVDKAVRSHPQYAKVELLQREMNTLAAQLGIAQQSHDSAGISNELAAQSDSALQQEFQDRMKGKQADVEAEVNSKLASFKEQLEAEMQAYGQELDKTYQPDIFNIQLKIKTVQVSKEEMAAMQKELEDLQNKRSAMLSAKEQELTTRWQAKLESAQSESGKRLDEYSVQLGNELSMRGAQNNSVNTALNQTDNKKQQASTELEKQLELKRQELTALQSAMIADIKDKAAKVAVDKGLEIVIVKPIVNRDAVDITETVIAEGKK